MRRLMPAFAIASAIAVTSWSTALAAGVTTVSGPSPYATCTLGGAGTNYVNAEAEPYLGVSPDGTNIIAVYQQDRWSNGGAHGGAASYSTDGGSTWQENTLPFSACAPGGLNFPRASDFWVSIGPDGTAYASGLPFDTATNHNGVANAVSTDGGRTWKHSQTVVEYPAGDFQHSTDKNSITADPGKAGVAYTVWDTLVSPNGNPDADLHASGYNGDGWFTKTIDGGQNWSLPRVIFPTSERRQTIGNHIVVGRDGALYDFANWIVQPNTRKDEHDQLAFVKSTDGGASWSAPRAIFDLNAISVTDPNTGQLIRTGDIIPETTIDPVTGTLYAVWQDAAFSGARYDEIAMTSSTDGGATWSAPTRVNTPSGRPAFTPSVAAYGGRVGVTYYDFRNLAAGNTTTLPTDYWARVSTDGGSSFGADQHLFGSFDMLTAPYARGFFVGDYEGLAAGPAGFTAAFVAANSGNTVNRTDVFVTRF